MTQAKYSDLWCRSCAWQIKNHCCAWAHYVFFLDHLQSIEALWVQIIPNHWLSTISGEAWFENNTVPPKVQYGTHLDRIRNLQRRSSPHSGMLSREIITTVHPRWIQFPPSVITHWVRNPQGIHWSATEQGEHSFLPINVVHCMTYIWGGILTRNAIKNQRTY